MAKSLLRFQARELRNKGESVRSIAKQLHVAKSTASLWVRDIVLSIEQLEHLRLQHITGSEKGRLLGALRQKNDRISRINLGITEGKKILEHIPDRAFFTAGIALYWAEGNKTMKRLEFCNSDPKLVQFLIHWFQRYFKLDKRDFKCYVGINDIHRDREAKVKQYWTEITGISLSQFTKTSFKKSKAMKLFENHNDHYGTLSVKIVKPARILYKVLGLVEALKLSKTSG